VLPSEHSAQRCADFIHSLAETSVRIVSVGSGPLHGIVFDTDHRPLALKYWQHYGDVISSRLAQAALELTMPEEDATVKATLKDRLAGFVNETTENVWLHVSGMAAMAHALRAFHHQHHNLKTVQLGFPYVDGLKMQTAYGPGAHFFPRPDAEAFDQIEHLAERGQISGVFCEVPGNPLLQTLDLEHLSQILRAHRVPLVVDDTVATYANVDVRAYADLVASSLTKLVSGVGDVMGGALVLSSESPLADDLRKHLEAEYEDLLWQEDAVRLEENSRDFLERARRVNDHTEVLVDHLRDHPAVERLWYPKFENRENYDAVRRPDGGYGGLFSLLLKDAERTSIPFYDALRISKGPSLGTNFSLACPYTLLAHYDELEWAEELGISRWLVRCSVGLEDPSDLIARFDEALAAAS